MRLLTGSDQEYLVSLTTECPEGRSILPGDGVRMVTRRCYLGGFIGNQYLGKAWMDKKVKGWTDPVELLAGVARRHLKTEYDGLKKSLQKEWYLVHSINPDMGRRSNKSGRPLKTSSYRSYSKGP